MFLPLVLRAFSWGKGNPVQLLQLIGIITAVGAVIFFWLDYKSAKRDVRILNEQVRAQTALAEASVARIDDFVVAQQEFNAILVSVRDQQAANRAQISQLTDSLSAPEIERIVDETPDQASDIVTDRLNGLLCMFNENSGPSSSRSPGCSKASTATSTNAHRNQNLK